MKINVTTSHELAFHIAYFEHAEGGMDTETFGPKCADLHSSISVLSLARVSRPGHDWVIVCEVATQVHGHPAPPPKS